MTDREAMRSAWYDETQDEMDAIEPASPDPPPDRGASASPSSAPPKAPPKAPTQPTRPASPAPTFGSADAPPPYVETEPAPPAFDAHPPGFAFFGARPERFFHLDHLHRRNTVSAGSGATPRRKRGAPWNRTRRACMWLASFGVFACFAAATGLTVASLKLLSDKGVGAAG
jgi:hypothetical protein